jgi:Kef-type K+ transport system membrane component KefB
MIGKRLMSATFVTDFGTAAALSILFVKPSVWIVPFVLVSLVLIVGVPRLAPWFFRNFGNRVIEPEIKLVFACLFLLLWLGDRAHSHAVLPAFVLGLVLSSHYVQHRKEQERLRVVAFAFLTPFFFLRGGMNISLSALWANLGALALLFGAKMIPKLAGVYPLARRYAAPHGAFTTLLMSTGLTFGTISSLYGLQAGIIDETQFSLLVAVVVLSAILPTAIAQRFFQPDAAVENRRDADATVSMPAATVAAAREEEVSV